MASSHLGDILGNVESIDASFHFHSGCGGNFGALLSTDGRVNSVLQRKARRTSGLED